MRPYFIDIYNSAPILSTTREESSNYSNLANDNNKENFVSNFDLQQQAALENYEMTNYNRQAMRAFNLNDMKLAMNVMQECFSNVPIVLQDNQTIYDMMNNYLSMGSNINNSSVRQFINTLRASGIEVHIIRPGSMVTMDVDPNRININVNHNGYIISVHFG